VVILTANGKNFCAGADLTGTDQSEDLGKWVYKAGIEFYRPLIESITQCDKIVIGAINGAAAGAGSGVAMACDLRVMDEDSYILQAFINIALVPDAGATHFLVRQIGYAKALELCLGGKPISSKQCLELGLTNKVVKKGELLKATREWAEELANKSAAATSLTKNVLKFAVENNLHDSAEYEFRIQQFLVGGNENLECVSAFFDKRKPTLTHNRPSIPGGIISRL